jgi:site-specific recombinase XerD
MSKKSRSKTVLTVSQAIAGYLLAAEGAHLKPGTLVNYQDTFKNWRAWLGDDDPAIAAITKTDLVEFFASFTTVSKSTVLRHQTALSALYTWLVAERLVSEHLPRAIRRVRPEEIAIEPYSEDELRAILGALEKSKTYSRPGKRDSEHSTQHGTRNRAIILLLLDTGIRASELCGLLIRDVDTKQRRIHITSGKRDKGRYVPFGARTGQAIWKYLTTRPDAKTDDYLFVNRNNNPLDRKTLYRALMFIGARAGVTDMGVHRFRHTFAIMFIRNGMRAGGFNPWALQEILGHTTLEMVRRYLRIVNADTSQAHTISSPVEKLRL